MKKTKVLHLTSSPFSTGGIEVFLKNVNNHINDIEFEFLTTLRITDNDLTRQMKQRGAKFIELNITDTNHFLRAAKMVFRTTQVLKKQKYSIVHIHSGSIPVVFYLLLAACLAKVPVKISHSHSSSAQYVHGIKEIVYKIMKHFITHHSDYLLACSLSAQKWMFTNNAAKSKYRIIKNGISLEKFLYDERTAFQYRQKYGLENNIIIGNVGRLTYSKNQAYLIPIIKALLTQYTNVILILIGEGEDDQELKEAVAKEGLESYIQFGGKRNDIPQLLSMFDIFLLPSRWEGLGIVNIEAQVSGLPVIASEYIPPEAIFTDLVQLLPLKNYEDHWINAVRQLINAGFKERKSRLPEAKAAGYDINDVCTELQNFYHGIMISE